MFENVLLDSFRSFVYMGDDDGEGLFVYMAAITTKESLSVSLANKVIKYN